MPQKSKYSKDEIVQIALEFVKQNGIEKLSARELAKELKSSICPIFTAFKDMEELKIEVKKRAKTEFLNYISKAKDYVPAYKMRGMLFVKFAQNEPMLFQFLFMQKNNENVNFTSAMEMSPFDKENDKEIIMRDYNATESQAEQMFTQMWIYTYGLCVLCATKVCTFSEDEIAFRLGEIFQGMVHVIRSNLEDKAKVKPANKRKGESFFGVHPDLNKKD